MYTEILATDLTEGHHNATYGADLPNKCPHCAVSISPVILSCQHRYNSNKFDIYILFLCPSCGQTFFSIYESKSHTRNSLASLVTTYPHSNIKIKHDEKIAELSPDFVKIYDESYSAEQAGLYEICGMGYRKAIEFLIKDFAIKFHPNDEDKIKSLTLSQCIKDYVDNPRIKKLATASVWLGNDQTHYVKKHEDYDIDSMKSFIGALIDIIKSELLVISADEFIQSLRG